MASPDHLSEKSVGAVLKVSQLAAEVIGVDHMDINPDQVNKL